MQVEEGGAQGWWQWWNRIVFGKLQPQKVLITKRSSHIVPLRWPDLRGFIVGPKFYRSSSYGRILYVFRTAAMSMDMAEMGGMASGTVAQWAKQRRCWIHGSAEVEDTGGQESNKEEIGKRLHKRKKTAEKVSKKAASWAVDGQFFVLSCRERKEGRQEGRKGRSKEARKKGTREQRTEGSKGLREERKERTLVILQRSDTARKLSVLVGMCWNHIAKHMPKF